MNLLAVLTDATPAPAAAAATPAPMWNPLTSGGTVDDHMQYVYTWIFWTSVVIGVGVSIALIYAFIKFRRRSDDEEPEQVHGSSKLEWTWTVTPYAILMVLFVISALNMSYVVTLPSDVAAKTPPLEITVVGEQFSWTYIYQDASNAEGKHVSTATDLYVPADTPVELHVISTDVSVLDANSKTVPSGCFADPSNPAVEALIRQEAAKGTDKKLQLAAAIADQGCGVNHSFFIPSLAGQINAIPGQVNYLWFDARVGTYYGQCTELCGTGHGDMLIQIHALSPGDYQAWLTKQEAK